VVYYVPFFVADRMRAAKAMQPATGRTVSTP